MNRKIIALAIVPIIVGMSGVIAFSQIVGSSNVNFTATQADLSFTQAVYWTNTTEVNSAGLYVTGNVGMFTSPNPNVPNRAIDTETSIAPGYNLTSDIKIGNLAIGDTVGFTVMINNTGDQALMVSAAPSSMVPSGVAAVAFVTSYGQFTSDMSSTSLAGYYVVYALPISGTIIPSSGSAEYVLIVGLNSSTNTVHALPLSITVQTSITSYR